LRCAAVPNRDDFIGAEGRLEAAERAAAVLDALDYAIEVLKMFPDKATYARVGGDVLVGAVCESVSLRRTTNRDVINVGDCGIGDLGL
jgi:hypothetical protein